MVEEVFIIGWIWVEFFIFVYIFFVIVWYFGYFKKLKGKVLLLVVILVEGFFVGYFCLWVVVEFCFLVFFFFVLIFVEVVFFILFVVLVFVLIRVEIVVVGRISWVGWVVCWWYWCYWSCRGCWSDGSLWSGCCELGCFIVYDVFYGFFYWCFWSDLVEFDISGLYGIECVWVDLRSYYCFNVFVDEGLDCYWLW